MNVADSSYLIEGLLREASLFEDEKFVARDVSLYEVANTLWKHEVILGDIRDSSERIHLFFCSRAHSICSYMKREPVTSDRCVFCSGLMAYSVPVSGIAYLVRPRRS